MSNDNIWLQVENNEYNTDIKCLQKLTCKVMWLNVDCQPVN